VSKASEWITKRPRFTVPITDPSGATVSAWAEVNDRGGLRVITPEISSVDALKLARWILDTFSDEATR